MLGNFADEPESWWQVRLLLLWLLLCCFCPAAAALETAPAAVEVTDQFRSEHITSYTQRFHDTANQYTVATITKAMFEQQSVDNFPAGTLHLRKGSHWIRFSIRNGSDKDLALVLTFLHFTKVPFYRLEGQELVQLNMPEPDGLHEVPLPQQNFAHPFTAPAGSLTTYYCHLHDVGYSDNGIRVYLMRRDRYLHLYHAVPVFHLISLGALSILFFFMLFQLILIRRSEFLYYCGYLFCFLFMFTYGYILSSSDFSVTHKWQNVSETQLSMLAFLLYFAFADRLLEMRKTLPLLHRIMYSLRVALVLYMALDMAVFVLFSFVKIQLLVAVLVRSVLVLAALVCIVIAYRQGSRMAAYFATGTLFFVAGGAAATYLYLWPVDSLSVKYNLLRQPMFYFRIGLILEALFLSLCLAYRHRITETARIVAEQELIRQQQVRELERQHTIRQTQERERERVSQELHDDLGAGLTTIRFLSEIAGQKVREQPLDEIRKISDSAEELLENMDNIIWAMKTTNSTLQDTALYIRGYAIEFLETYRIACEVQLPRQVPDVELSAEQKRNLFLTVKECLHNIVKHAQACQVRVEMDFGSAISISIRDNGTGLAAPAGKKRNGNGLANMQKRMELIGGRFELRNNAPEPGATALLYCPLHLPVALTVPNDTLPTI